MAKHRFFKVGIHYTYLLDAFFLFSIEKKPGRFEGKSGKTQSSKLKQNYICFVLLRDLSHKCSSCFISIPIYLPTCTNVM
jgi:hypothetical protein